MSTDVIVIVSDSDGELETNANACRKLTNISNHITSSFVSRIQYVESTNSSVISPCTNGAGTFSNRLAETSSRINVSFTEQVIGQVTGSSLSKCPLESCDSAGFASDRVLLEHILAFHRTDIFYCAACDVPLKSASALALHCETKHRGLLIKGITDSAARQAAADRAFAENEAADSDLEIVEETQLILPSFVCTKCDYVTRHQNELYEHCSTHKDLRFCCAFCSYVCKSFKDISQHRNTVHKDIKVVPTCRFQCGFKNVQRVVVLRHEANCRLSKATRHCVRCAFVARSNASWQTHLASADHRRRKGLAHKPRVTQAGTVADIKIHKFTGQIYVFGRRLEDYPRPRSNLLQRLSSLINTTNRIKRK